MQNHRRSICLRLLSALWVMPVAALAILSFGAPVLSCGCNDYTVDEETKSPEPPVCPGTMIHVTMTRYYYVVESENPCAWTLDHTDVLAEYTRLPYANELKDCSGGPPPPMPPPPSPGPVPPLPPNPECPPEDGCGVCGGGGRAGGGGGGYQASY